MLGLLRGRYGTGARDLLQSRCDLPLEVVRRALCVWLRVYGVFLSTGAEAPTSGVRTLAITRKSLILVSGVLEGPREAKIDSPGWFASENAPSE